MATAFFGGQFFGSEFFSTSAPTTSPSPVTRTYFAGFIPPKRIKKAKREEKSAVEVAVQQKEIKYVQITRSYASNVPIMEAVQSLTDLLAQNSVRSEAVRKKIAELEEEEDIIVILSSLQ